MAEDYGGPRKEFFRLILKEIQETFFQYGLRELLCEKYTTIGIIFGLSTLQNGKIPKFLDEETFQALFTDADTPSKCILNLRDGLRKTGIYQSGQQLPILFNLFRPSPATLTIRGLLNLLKPVFSEVGSNARKFENMIYSVFVKYLRETASGRRGNITLSHIPLFTTGGDEEPALGFTLALSIEFAEATTLFYPTANTRTACLK